MLTNIYTGQCIAMHATYAVDRHTQLIDIRNRLTYAWNRHTQWIGMYIGSTLTVDRDYTADVKLQKQFMYTMAVIVLSY